MKKEYLYNNKKELKKAFFAEMEDLNISTKGKKTKFDISLNIAFQEWKEGLKGLIPSRLQKCQLY